MEGRVENSRSCGISKRSRSLDPNCLGSEKSRAQDGQEKWVLKRRRWSPKSKDEVGFGQPKKRRKSRKEVSLSSFEDSAAKSGGGSKRLDSAGALDSGSGKLGLKLSGFLFLGKNLLNRGGDGRDSSRPKEENARNLGGLNGISHALEDGAVVIPKRPRGFLGRRKFQTNHVVGKQMLNSVSKRVVSRSSSLGGKTGPALPRSKVNGDPKDTVQSFLGKRKKILAEVRDNNGIGGSGSSSVLQHKGEGNAPVELAVLRGAKTAPRNKRKRRGSDREKGNLEIVRPNGENPVVSQNPEREKERLENVRPKVENSVNKRNSERERESQENVRPKLESSLSLFDDLQDDDEENLEQNAARMLSSRFDPSCTGFSGRGSASKSLSSDGSSFSQLFHKAFNSYGMDALLCSEVGSADSAGRVLRPRKQRKQKGFFRRPRRHFYEVCSLDLDPYWVVKQRIKVFWPLDKSWYFGVVKGYDSETKLHHVKYDDRDEEWINLQNERFKLLLLPGEVGGKSRSKKPGLEGWQAHENDEYFFDEDCMGNLTESEPIISWLSRSSHRRKQSLRDPTNQRKESHLLKTLPHAAKSVVMPNGCIEAGLSSDGRKLSPSLVVSERPAVEDTRKNLVQTDPCSNDRKMPIVYFRRCFHNRHKELGDPSIDKSICNGADSSVTLLASVVDRLRALDEFDVVLQSSSAHDLKVVGNSSLFTSFDNLELLKLFLSSQPEVSLKFSLPSLRILDFAFGVEHFQLFSAFFLLKYGALTSKWPSVRVEMLFVDNFVGLRFMLFEGCLKQAVVFLFFILAIFYQPEGCNELGNLQLPVTSIRLKLYHLHGCGRQMEFVFYNFLELKSSRWLHLDAKLKQHCMLAKELPLAECTYANIKDLQSGSGRIPFAPVYEKPISSEVLQKRPRQSIECRHCPSCRLDGKPRFLPPFVLSFAAAPTFFLSLHLNLLMENSVASISLQNHGLTSLREYPQNFDKLTGEDCFLDQDSEKPLAVQCSSSCVSMTTAPRWLSGLCSKAEAVASSLDGGDLVETSQKTLNGENGDNDVLGTAVSSQGAGRIMSDTSAGLEKCQCHSGSGKCVGESCSSAPEDLSLSENSENGCLSHFNRETTYIDDDRQLDHPTQTTKLSARDSGGCSTTDDTICSSNPTAPRTTWHRNRNGSICSYRSKLWPDFIGNGFANGSRKPRTQVSYLLPFGGYNFGSKPRSHRRKGHPYKRMKNDNAKKVSDDSGSPQRYPDLLSSDANVLVTVGDRCWRECGAQVVLESVDHKEWLLLVKISGVTKYSHKAHQFLQPGTTNRYTHAMMWKGGKDWILEFPDRSQWVVFKEIHEECYNRNIRAASVKNIPIPGVRLIEDSDDNTMEVPFVRTPKYFRHIGTDVDLAMDPARILYDLNSDDEEWISKARSSSDANGIELPEISEEIFERVMDMFEKLAYAQQRDNFTDDEIQHLMVGVASMDAIKAIHDHWWQKRKRKGMPLIRHLQPALWERYQQQVKEWELAMSKGHSSIDVCQGKGVMAEKPAMFAFCLRPRGLEVPNKGTKQKSQRKFTVLGHHSGFSRDSDGPQVTGRKLNGFVFGDERGLVTEQNHLSSDISLLLQTSTKLSPRDMAGTGILSMSSDWSESNQYLKLYRSKSKKYGVNLSPRDSLTAPIPINQRMIGKRNEACQWNMGLPEWQSPKCYQPDVFHRHRADQLGGPDLDEFKLRDASGAAQHALNMARLKREKANRLLMKADLALHKAAVAVMTVEAIKAAEIDFRGEG